MQIVLDQTFRDMCIGMLQPHVFVRHILYLRKENITQSSFDLDGMLCQHIASIVSQMTTLIRCT